MFLPLAERMVEKMVKEDKIEAEAEVSYSLPPPPAGTGCSLPCQHPSQHLSQHPPQHPLLSCGPHLGLRSTILGSLSSGLQQVHPIQACVWKGKS